MAVHKLLGAELEEAPGATPELRTVRVALIDSGVLCDHPLAGPIEAELALAASADGGWAMGPGRGDFLGHGTACAAVIRALAPGVRLHSIRLFEHELTAAADQLAYAIRWAARARLDILNLSLGAHPPNGRRRVERACRSALRAGCVLVAAAEEAEATYLGSIPGVISAYACGDCGWGEYLIDTEHPWRIGACPYPVRLPGVPPDADFHGSSIAASHVSGLICRLKMTCGSWDPRSFQARFEPARARPAT